jgi:hypothetical protein
MPETVSIPLAADVPPATAAGLFLLAYGAETAGEIAEGLSRLVPHLHPDEARQRFGALVKARGGLLKAAMSPLSEDQFAGLVAHALRQLSNPSVAFDEDGQPWAAPVVETVTAAA